MFPLPTMIRLAGAWLAGTRPKLPFTNNALLTIEVSSALKMKPPELTNWLLTIFVDPPDHVTARPKSLRSNRTWSRTRFPLPSMIAVTPFSPSMAFGSVLLTIRVRVRVTFAPSAPAIAARLQPLLKSTISLADESVIVSDALCSTLARVGMLWNFRPEMSTATALLSASKVPIWMNPNVCLRMSEFSFVGQMFGRLIWPLPLSM